MSPCSPVTSAIGYLQRSSASSPSTSHQKEEQKLGDANNNPQLPASQLENLTLSVLRGSPTPPPTSTDRQELAKVLIPLVNIVPSTPIQCSPTASVLPSAEQEAIMSLEREINILKQSKVGSNAIISTEKCGEIKDSNSGKEQEHNISTSSQPPKHETFKQSPRPDDMGRKMVKMTLEHTDDDQICANNLKNTQQFPVVTRRFRQVPNQSSKENIAEEYPKGVLEDTVKAQVIVDPTTSEKEPEISAETTKRTAEDNDNVCEAEMDVAIISCEDITTQN